MVLNMYISALACMLQAANTNSSEDTLQFVFEIARHGARAPTFHEFLDGFSGNGLLTPQGMRQRYLLGRFARDRYTKQYDLFSPNYIFGEVLI